MKDLLPHTVAPPATAFHIDLSTTTAFSAPLTGSGQKDPRPTQPTTLHALQRLHSRRSCALQPPTRNKIGGFSSQTAPHINTAQQGTALYLQHLHIRPWTRRATHHRITRSVSSVFSGFSSSCLCYAHSARFLRIFCCCCARGHVGSGTFSGETSLLLHRSCVLQSVRSESTKG
jgi:hypothetical protein